MENPDYVQMRALVKSITMVGALTRGQIFWCSERHAQHFIENNIAEIVEPGSLLEPPEKRLKNPDEIKAYLDGFESREAGISEAKKSSSENQPTQSTDSQESNAPGEAEPQSASPQAQASQPIKSKPSTLTLPKRAKS
jgi:hypothetical protein